jgi:uncharacterized protein (DUF305 family)
MGADKIMHQLGSSPARRWVLGAVVVGGAVILTTAFRAPQTSQTAPVLNPSGQHAMAPTRAQAEFDQQFIDLMVPHHQGAVEMARIAQVRGEHQEIKDLAAAIIQGQSAEIDQMKAWRLAWYGSDQTPPMDQMPMLHDMPGMGAMAMTMNMAQEVEVLRNAPEPFDRAFIDAMIPHHQSAIDAAQLAQQQAVHQEIKDRATAIIFDQQREIDQMQQWRLSWYGTAASPTVLPDAPMNMPGTGH